MTKRRTRHKAPSSRSTVAVEGDLPELMDSYTEQHPLGPKRARIVDAAVRQYLAAEEAAGNFTPPSRGVQ